MEGAALIGSREAAKLCGLGLSTWKRYVAAQWVPAPIRLGNTLRWRLDVLEAWIDAGCPRDFNPPQESH